MKLPAVAYLYAVRLKARTVLVQEAFAILGIAVGVGLLFASQIASASLNGSVRQLTSAVVGRSQYQLKARDLEGFNGALLGDVRRLPGVRAAVPVLEHPVNLIGPTGRQGAVELIATDPQDLHLAGSLLRHLSPAQLAGQQALALPAPVAREIGAQSLVPIKLQVGARAVPTLVATVLQSAEIGTLVHSPVAIAPLRYAQQLIGLPGRVSRIFVQAQPGREQEVLRGLRRLAAGRLNVEPALFDATLFEQAATPVNQSTETFAAICALVGFVFAYSAMLLTMPLRQAHIRRLRLFGATRAATVRALLLDALVLGGLGSLAGLALGELFAKLVFSAGPRYLSFAFPVGTQQVVTFKSLAIAILAGLLAAAIGVLTPLRDIWTRREHAGVPRSGSPARLRVALLSAGLLCLALTTTIFLAAPGSTIVAMATLTLTLLLLLPVLLDLTIALLDRAQRRLGAVSLEIAAVELRSPSVRMRSLAIAATAAIAVFAGVTILGSRANLEGGLERGARQISSVTDVWVTPAGEQDQLASTPFPNTLAPALARLAGVRAVGLYRGGLLEDGDRRVWVLAPPSTAAHPFPPRELLAGNLALATARLRAGGWTVISQKLAEQRHLRIGEPYRLPAPRPTAFRIAALITNLGWPPGAVVLNPTDFARAWESADVSAYNLALAPRASPATVAREARRALGPASGLIVQTASQRFHIERATVRSGLVQLNQISVLILFTGAFATALSLAAVIWQRRRRFALMKIQGFDRPVLWRALVWESAVLLGCSCLLGAAFGVYGQLLLSHALLNVTGFPLLFSARIPLALGIFALVVAVAGAIVIGAGYRAAGARAEAQR
ncbi:MAG TPA: ABC transporter permease [Solirubrobacteraceae bacterium]|nr:ABC transporter permease [Solirubrobacteraceae bacterium]